MTMIEAAVLFGFEFRLCWDARRLSSWRAASQSRKIKKQDAPDKAELHGTLLLPVKEITCNKSENLL
ncbi:MAG: hypothetical protein V8Q79_02705 [Christensenellales bacterium]